MEFSSEQLNPKNDNQEAGLGVEPGFFFLQPLETRFGETRLMSSLRSENQISRTTNGVERLTGGDIEKGFRQFQRSVPDAPFLGRVRSFDF